MMNAFLRPFYKILRPVYRKIQILFTKIHIRHRAKKSVVKIVVGASNLYDKGWIPTEIDFLNLLKESDWQSLFKRESIDAILAEHVWEHLSLEEGAKAAKMCYLYLKPKGYLRVAVPDGYHFDPEYIEKVKPGGTGAGAEDHKVLYTCDSFRKIFEEAGFHIKLLEWFDKEGNFHFQEWNYTEGKILRSKRLDQRNQDSLNYTSLILDAFK